MQTYTIPSQYRVRRMASFEQSEGRSLAYKSRGSLFAPRRPVPALDYPETSFDRRESNHHDHRAAAGSECWPVWRNPVIDIDEVIEPRIAKPLLIVNNPIAEQSGGNGVVGSWSDSPQKSACFGEAGRITRHLDIGHLPRTKRPDKDRQTPQRTAEALGHLAAQTAWMAKNKRKRNPKTIL